MISLLKINNIFHQVTDITEMANLLKDDKLLSCKITQSKNEDNCYTDNNGTEITINTIVEEAAEAKNNVKYIPQIIIQSTNKNNQPKNIFLLEMIQYCDFNPLDTNLYINNCYMRNNNKKIEENYFFKYINCNIEQNNDKIILQNYDNNYNHHQCHYLLYIDGQYHILHKYYNAKKYQLLHQYYDDFNIHKERLLDKVSIIKQAMLKKKHNQQKDMKNFKIDGKDLVLTSEKSNNQKIDLLSANCQIFHVYSEILNLHNSNYDSYFIEIQGKYYSCISPTAYFQKDKLYIDTTHARKYINKFIIINEEQESIMVEYYPKTEQFQQVKTVWSMYAYNIMEYLRLFKQSQQKSSPIYNQQKTIYLILIVISVLIILLLLIYQIYNSCCK